MTKPTFESEELWISDGRGNGGMVWVERAAIELLTASAGLTAVGVYVTLVGRSVGTGNVATERPTNASLGADMGLSARQIRRYVKTLDELGFVARVRLKAIPGSSQRPVGVLLVDEWKRRKAAIGAENEVKDARKAPIRLTPENAELADKSDREIENSRTNMTASSESHIKERARARASSDSINSKEEDLLRKSVQQAALRPSPHRELLLCIESELHIDGALYGYPRLAKETKALLDAGITPDWVRQFKAWYERDRWTRGFTTPLTSVAQIRGHWGQFRDWVKNGRPRSEDKPAKFEPSVVAIDQANEAMAEQEVTINDFLDDIPF